VIKFDRIGSTAATLFFSDGFTWFAALDVAQLKEKLNHHSLNSIKSWYLAPLSIWWGIVSFCC
jgi:hypothetical protein